MMIVHYKLPSWSCLANATLFLLIFSSTHGEIVDNGDFTVERGQPTEDKNQITNRLPAVTALGSLTLSDSPQALHKHLSAIKTTILQFESRKQHKTKSQNAVKSRKPRSGQIPEALPNITQTSEKLVASHVDYGVISPTPVLTGVLRSKGLYEAGEAYESPAEVQDDKNEDMLNLLNARGFSYTVLPDDMMSKYPDIVKQIDAEEMDGPGSEAAERDGPENEDQEKEGPENEGPENEGPGSEGNEQEGNELDENEDDEKDLTDEQESALGNQTESESSNRNSEQDEHLESELQSSMTEQTRDGTESPYYNNEGYLDLGPDYHPYYSQLEPGQTATNQQPLIVPLKIHRLRNVTNTNSGRRRRPGSRKVNNVANTNSGRRRKPGPHKVNNVTDTNLGEIRKPGSQKMNNVTNTNSGERRKPGSQKMNVMNTNSGERRKPGSQKMNNVTNTNSGERRKPGSQKMNNVTNTNSGQSRNANTNSGLNQPGSVQMHQLHNVANTNSGLNQPGSAQMHQLSNVANANSGLNPTVGSQAKMVNSASTPTKTKTVVRGLSASTMFGIVAGCLIGSWMILGPTICLVCKYRDARKEKKKRFNQRLHEADSNNGITEAMIMSELGKQPLKLHSTKVKQQQRESTYSDKSDTFHDVFETPPLLL